MKIVIQGFWNAIVTSVKNTPTITPEEVIKERKHIVVCTVIIDGKYFGDVTFDGDTLTVKQQCGPIDEHMGFKQQPFQP